MEYAPAGAFMFLSGFAQFAWVLWMLEPSAQAIRTGIAGNLGIIGLWILSRTIGLPIGRQPWVPEDIHSTDIMATALEVVVVLSCAALLRPLLIRGTHRLAALAATGTLLAVVATAHEPSRERAVAAAAIVLVAVTAGLSAAMSRLPARRANGRDHVEAFSARRRRVVVDGGAWPTVRTGGI